MNQEEIKAMYKATCEICMLADAMKNCPICKFYQKEKEIKENVSSNQLH